AAACSSAPATGTPSSSASATASSPIAPAPWCRARTSTSSACCASMPCTGTRTMPVSPRRRSSAISSASPIPPGGRRCMRPPRRARVPSRCGGGNGPTSPASPSARVQSLPVSGMNAGRPMQPSEIPRDASHPTATEPAVLPHGVFLRRLVAHLDERGRVGEIFRDEWPTGIAPVQWAVAVSAAGVMRGVHVHIRHDDYFVLLQGRLALGLRDLRRGAPRGACPALLELRGEEPVAVVVPHGVAHGFLFLEPSTYVLG